MQHEPADHLLDNEDYKFSPALTKHFATDSLRIYSLAGDASARRYYRVLHNENSWVLMQWEPFDPAEYPFLSVLKHFDKHGIDVPKVEKIWPDQGLILLEDLGDLTLERKFWESQNQELCLDFYRLAIEQLARIHYPASANKTDCTAFHIAFDHDKLLWEMNYAKKYLLQELLRYKMDPQLEKNLEKIFSDISSRLAAEPRYIAHRDYHSRNLMITLDDLRVIDFQDARMGPVQYDLVSLLKDSYVNIQDSMAEELLNYYLDLRNLYQAPTVNKEQFMHIYELQSIQRCFKACGSFASFKAMRNDNRYLKYIPGTVRRVLKSLGHFPEYKLISDTLIDSGAMDFHSV